jgi:rhodanese-related sulfurtransferase
MLTHQEGTIMRLDRAKRVSGNAGAVDHLARRAWLTVTWQLAAVLLTAAALGLSSNQLRTTRLPLIGNWSPEAQLTMESGESLVVSLTDTEMMYFAHAAIFLDARSPQLYDEGHIEGALNLPWLNYLPWEELDTRIAETLRDFSLETTFVTYCDGEGCSLSKELALAMRERGYTDVRVLVNGWTLWQNKRLPVDNGLAAALVR